MMHAADIGAIKFIPSLEIRPNPVLPDALIIEEVLPKE